MNFFRMAELLVLVYVGAGIGTVFAEGGRRSVYAAIVLVFCAALGFAALDAR